MPTNISFISQRSTVALLEVRQKQQKLYGILERTFGKNFELFSSSKLHMFTVKTQAVSNLVKKRSGSSIKAYDLHPGLSQVSDP